jgi:hypothetical protein
MSDKTNLKFKIRKWTKFEDLSIRPRTVRVRTTDRSPYQDLDSPSQQSRPSKLTGRGPSAVPARTGHSGLPEISGRVFWVFHISGFQQ